jgi:predicted dehydrogenase
MKTLGIGIIGLHHLHPVDYLTHFRALEQTEVRGIFEEDATLRGEVCSKAGIQEHSELDELLGREDIDLVVLFLPHADCPKAAEKAARAGKHLIVEKPMAATAAGIRQMIEATQKAGVTLSAPYCWRCHPAAREIKRLVADGVLGEVVALQGRCAAGSVERYRANGIQPWILDKEKGGGGPMHNLGVHWIDLFRWLLEDEVQEVTGMVSHMQHHVEVEDNSFALLRFEGGATASLDISYSVPNGYPAGRDLFIGIRGTRGALSWMPAWGGTADEVFVCSDREDMVDGPVRTFQIGSSEVGGYGGISGLVYLRETAAAIAAGRPPEITGLDGLRALQVVEAVYKAADTGRAVAVDYQ